MKKGLLGSEDSVIKDFVNNNQTFDGLPLSGPFAGDSLFYHASPGHLLVYAYHDQGLAAFKAKWGLNGFHLTTGLPFLRISPDFGTGPGLLGGSYASMISLLQFARIKNGH